MPDRISLENSMFPVQTFFNAISDAGFPRVVENLLRGVGAGAESSNCDFPSDLDDDEPPFEGVRFSIFEEEVVISEEELMHLLLAVCEKQASRMPEQSEAIEELTARIQERL